MFWLAVQLFRSWPGGWADGDAEGDAFPSFFSRRGARLGMGRCPVCHAVDEVSGYLPWRSLIMKFGGNMEAWALGF